MSNGGSPSTAKYMVAPSAQKSAGGPLGSPLACSGAMYPGEPMTRPVAVSWGSPWRDATPKSASFTPPSVGTITLPGLTSR